MYIISRPSLIEHILGIYALSNLYSAVNDVVKITCA